MELGEETKNAGQEAIDPIELLRHSAAEVVLDILDRPDSNELQGLLDEYLNAATELLESLRDIQFDLLKDPDSDDCFDLADMGTELLKIPCTFFSDMLGGAENPNDQLTGLARLQTIFQSSKMIKLTSPQGIRCIDYSDITAEQLRDKNVTFNSVIQSTDNSVVYGDTSGLPVKQLLQLRQAQAWILQTNSSYLCAREQSPELKQINVVHRQPYQTEINHIIFESYRYRKDPKKFASEIQNVHVKAAPNRHDDQTQFYQCKDVPTYTVLAIQEHMRNLTTIQKDIISARQMLCDAIAAVSRTIIPALDGINESDEITTTRAKTIIISLEEIEGLLRDSIYEELLQHVMDQIYNPELEKTDHMILSKSACDLEAKVQALHESICAISSATLVVNSMCPLATSDTLSPLVAFSYKFSVMLQNLKDKTALLLGKTKDFASQYQLVRTEYQSKMGINFSQVKNGVKEHKKVVPDDAPVAVTQESEPQQSVVNGAQSPRRPGFFSSSDGSKSPLPSPRGTAPSTRQVSKNPSPRSTTSSPRALSRGGSPRSNGSPRDHLPHSRSEEMLNSEDPAADVNIELATMMKPSAREAQMRSSKGPGMGSVRRKAMDNRRNSRGDRADSGDFSGEPVAYYPSGGASSNIVK